MNFKANEITAAINCLQQQEPFTLGPIRIQMDTTGSLVVHGWSHFTNIKNLRQLNCTNELQEIKNLFHEALALLPALQEFIIGKDITYQLLFDDYGKASVLICEEKNNMIYWYFTMKE